MTTAIVLVNRHIKYLATIAKTPEQLERLAELRLPFCEGFSGPCGRFGQCVSQNTAYVDEFLNYHVLCPECEVENSEHWAGMLRDYYSDVLDISERGLYDSYDYD